MGMVKRIYELQQIEAALASTHKQLEEIHKHIEFNDAFEGAKQAFEIARHELVELEKQYKNLDAEAEELRKNIKGVESKLYGGTVRNPKELVGYEQEAGIMKSRLDKMDDTLLEMMERIESGKANTGKLKGAFDDAEKAWASEKADLQQKADEARAELALLESKRRDVLKDIDRGSLSLYEGIKGRKSHAVARVEQGRCMGCRCLLSVSELQRVRGSSIVQCSNCGRILYLS